MLKIVLVPNKVLTTPVKPVTKFDAALKKLILQMEETLIAQVDPEGVGLAAPQVGVDLSLFIMRQSTNSDTEVFINPKILEIEKDTAPSPKKKNKNVQLEGCLSIPRIWSPIERPQKIHVEYQTIDGEKKDVWLKGLKAVIVQHEIDHLNGILFTQRAVEQSMPLYEEKDDDLKKIDFT